MNGLDLFSGIGGNSIGLKGYVRTVAYCEADRHAQSVLLSRMGDGSLDKAPIWDDICTLRGEHFNIPIDIIVGGFPCQDISVAGKGEGIVEGNRSGLFYQIVRLAKEIQPQFLFLENVPAIRTKGLDVVVQELTEAGYDLRWCMLSAAEVGAPHKRDRWFCLAHKIMANSDDKRRWDESFGVSRSNDSVFSGSNGGTGLDSRNGSSSEGSKNQGHAASKANAANANGQSNPRLPSRTKAEVSFTGVCGVDLGDSSELLGNGSNVHGEYGQGLPESGNPSGTANPQFSWTSFTSDICGVADGVPYRVERLKRLGNAVVPLQARKAFEELMFGKQL